MCTPVVTDDVIPHGMKTAEEVLAAMIVLFRKMYGEGIFLLTLFMINVTFKC